MVSIGVVSADQAGFITINIFNSPGQVDVNASNSTITQNVTLSNSTLNLNVNGQNITISTQPTPTPTSTPSPTPLPDVKVSIPIGTSPTYFAQNYNSTLYDNNGDAYAAFFYSYYLNDTSISQASYFANFAVSGEDFQSANQTASGVATVDGKVVPSWHVLNTQLLYDRFRNVIEYNDGNINGATSTNNTLLSTQITNQIGKVISIAEGITIPGNYFVITLDFPTQLTPDQQLVLNQIINGYVILELGLPG